MRDGHSRSYESKWAGEQGVRHCGCELFDGNKQLGSCAGGTGDVNRTTPRVDALHLRFDDFPSFSVVTCL